MVMFGSSRALFLLWCFVLAFSFAKGDYVYVSAVGGNDVDGCGLVGAPCQSVGYAVRRTANGDTVSIAPGVYSGNANKQISPQGIILAVAVTV